MCFNMATFIQILCLSLFVTSLEALSRHKRAGGRVDIVSRIQAPKRLRNGETHQPPPGWAHCIHKITATMQWRMISSLDLGSVLTTQYQCTWLLQTDTPGMKLKIAIQKLDLGNPSASTCSQFLEMIDHGKTQGRFCKQNIPGDYVSIGKQVRIDIQGDDALSRLVRQRKNPFVVSYKAVSGQETSGFRKMTSKPKEYDRYHIPTNKGKNRSGMGTGDNRYKNGNKDSKDETKAEGGLSMPQMVAIIVCSLIVALFILSLIVWRCCCDTAKRDHDEDEEKTSEKKGYPIQSYPLPGNEMIIASEVVARPFRASKSTSSGHISHESHLEKKPLNGNPKSKRSSRQNSKETKNNNRPMESRRRKPRDHKKREKLDENERRHKEDKKDSRERRQRKEVAEIMTSPARRHRKSGDKEGRKSRDRKKSVEYERHNRARPRKSKRDRSGKRDSSKSKKKREKSRQSKEDPTYKRHG